MGSAMSLRRGTPQSSATRFCAEGMELKKRISMLAIVVAFLSAMVQQAPDASSQTTPPIREMIGVNAVVNNNPSDIAKVAGWVRDYHKWYWYEPTKDTYTWSTGWQRLDSFYGSLKAAGVKVMPDVEFAPGWASSNGQIDGIPDAAQHAEYLGELARHYSDTIAAVENFNEPNQTWQPIRFPANIFGEMTARDYDAVKAANSKLPVVLAGMAGPDTTYLDAANQASGGKFDVVNFHWYAEGDTAAGGKNPEAGGLFEAIDRVRQWRDANAPGKPIWITEFGWDTFAQPDGRKSKIYAPEANAANYLLRSIFLMQGRGVEKAFAFIYRDVSSNEAYLHNVYSSSGLVVNDAEKDGRKKTGWYYLATLKGVLGEYVLDRIVSNGPNVYHYEYALPGSDKRAAVLWARNGLRDNGYTASYTAPAGTLVVPTAGSTVGTRSQTDGRLTLTERPVFVLYSGSPAATAAAQPTQTVAPTSSPVPTSPPTSPPATATPIQSTATSGGSTELLVNGGFESGLGNWFVPAWFAGAAKVDGTEKHSGSSALRFQGNVAGPYSYQQVAASPGQKVTFSGWVNIPQLSGDMSMVLELVPRHQYNGDLPAVRLATFSKATSGWTQVSGSAVMPARTAFVRLMVRFPRLNGTAYLDDLSLKADGAAPTPTVTASPTAPPATPAATNPPATPTPTAPPATAPPVPTQPTVAPTQVPATPTVGPTQPPAGNGALANTPWPSYGQNALRNNRSPYVGPQQQPRVKWTFNRSNDHWGTDYRGTGIGQNGTTYIAAGMTGVYALDSATGQMKWLWVPENTGHETWIEFPPTVAADGTLYVTSENDYLYALSKDGKVLWKFLSDHLHTPVSISPDGTTLHFISENGFVSALNRSDGSLKWKQQLGNKVYATGRRIPVVYDSAGNLYFAWISTVYSMTASGQVRWSVNVGNKGPYMVGPAVSDDGTLYFVYVQNVIAVGMDGKVKWQYTLGKSAFDRTPAIGTDGTAYIGAEDGFVYALNPNGSLKWKQQYANTTGWGGGIKSNILVDARGTLYFLTKDREILAVNSSTRQVLWSYSTGYGDNSYPGIQLSLDSDGTLYSPVNEGVAVALAPAVGGATGPTPIATPSPTATAVPTVAPTASPAPSGSTLWGAWVGSAVNVAGNESAFEQAVDKPRAIRHWYWSVAPISQSAANFGSWSASMPAGAILMLSWAPSPTDSSLDNVNAGKHDGYIVEWAKALKSYGREVWLRPMWEDNGSWYWWNSGGDWDTNKKNKYKSAFQRIVNLFRQEGAGNVKFVWSPHVSGSGAGTAKLSYPGSEYVDIIGLDGYPMRGGRGDFYSTFKPDYDALGTLGKPMIVAETSISIGVDGQRAQYVTNLLGYELPTRFPKFGAFVWFNEPGWGDLLDPKYPATLDAFRKGIGSQYYKGR